MGLVTGLMAAWRLTVVCMLLLWWLTGQVLMSLLWHTIKCVYNTMAAPTSTLALEPDSWAVDRATALPEVWALVAENSDGLVDAWRLMSVCRASRTGVKGFCRGSWCAAGVLRMR